MLKPQSNNVHWYLFISKHEQVFKKKKTLIFLYRELFYRKFVNKIKKHKSIK